MESWNHYEKREREEGCTKVIPKRNGERVIIEKDFLWVYLESGLVKIPNSVVDQIVAKYNQ